MALGTTPLRVQAARPAPLTGATRYFLLIALLTWGLCASGPAPAAGQDQPPALSGQTAPQAKVQARSAHIKPTPAKTKPQPAQAARKPSYAKPQPAQAVSRPSYTKPQPAQAVRKPSHTRSQQAKAAPKPGAPLSAQIAPKSAREILRDTPAPGANLKRQAAPAGQPGLPTLPLTPEMRPPAETVPAAKDPTLGQPKDSGRQAVGVRATILSKGSTKVTGIVSPVETTGQKKAPGQSESGVSGGPGAGLLFRHDF